MHGNHKDCLMLWFFMVKLELEKNSLEESLLELKKLAIKEVDAGATILILSDRGISKELCPIPIMLAVSTIHNELIASGKRMNV